MGLENTIDKEEIVKEKIEIDKIYRGFKALISLKWMQLSGS